MVMQLQYGEKFIVMVPKTIPKGKEKNTAMLAMPLGDGHFYG